MKIRRLAVLLAVCLTLTAYGTASQAVEKKKFSAVRMDMFDTVIMLTGYAENEAAFNENAEAVFGELHEMHRLYDVYNEYDGLVNICSINREAGGDALKWTGGSLIC